MAAAGIPFAQTQTNDNDNEEAEVHRWKVVVFTDKTSDGVRAGIRIPIMIKEVRRRKWSCVGKADTRTWKN